MQPGVGADPGVLVEAGGSRGEGPPSLVWTISPRAIAGFQALQMEENLIEAQSAADPGCRVGGACRDRAAAVARYYGRCAMGLLGSTDGGACP
jgi:hypothetical protein